MVSKSVQSYLRNLPVPYEIPLISKQVQETVSTTDHVFASVTAFLSFFYLF